jgi:hypothetical protein
MPFEKLAAAKHGTGKNFKITEICSHDFLTTPV